MIVAETKIESYPDSQFHIPGYNLYRNDRKKGGGGILVFISSKLHHKKLKCDKSYKSLEPIAIELSLRSKKLVLLGIYRPPKKLTGKYKLLFEEELSHISNWASLHQQNVAIFDDLNLNRLRPDTPEGMLLMDLEEEQEFESLTQ